MSCFSLFHFPISPDLSYPTYPISPTPPSLYPISPHPLNCRYPTPTVKYRATRANPLALSLLGLPIGQTVGQPLQNHSNSSRHQSKNLFSHHRCPSLFATSHSFSCQHAHRFSNIRHMATRGPHSGVQGGGHRVRAVPPTRRGRGARRRPRILIPAVRRSPVLRRARGIDTHVASLYICAG